MKRATQLRDFLKFSFCFRSLGNANMPWIGFAILGAVLFTGVAVAEAQTQDFQLLVADAQAAQSRGIFMLLRILIEKQPSLNL